MRFTRIILILSVSGDPAANNPGFFFFFFPLLSLPAIFAYTRISFDKSHARYYRLAHTTGSYRYKYKICRLLINVSDNIFTIVETRKRVRPDHSYAQKANKNVRKYSGVFRTINIRGRFNISTFFFHLVFVMRKLNLSE